MSRSWEDGMAQAIQIVRGMAARMTDLRAPAAQAALDEAIVRLEGSLERGGAPSLSQIEAAPAARRAPMQGTGGSSSRPARPSGSITWEEHEEIYAVYAARYGTSQSAQRIADRGGFGWTECEMLMKREPRTWRPA